MSRDPVVHLIHRVNELEERVRRLEQGAGLPVADPSEPSAQVREIAAAGNTLDAIREYQRQTGCSLEEARRRIEALPS